MCTVCTGLGALTLMQAYGHGNIPTAGRAPCEAQEAVGKKEGQWDVNGNKPWLNSAEGVPLLQADLPSQNEHTAALPRVCVVSLCGLF